VIEARTYDMAVIGSGPAGQKAAVQAAKLGKSVAVIERKVVVGGVCVNTGTIPSKTLREAVLYLSGLRERAFYGDAYQVKPKVKPAPAKRRGHGRGHRLLRGPAHVEGRLRVG